MVAPEENNTSFGIYSSWNIRYHVFIESSEFVYLDELMGVISHASRINFSVQSREETRQKIRDIFRITINNRTRAPENRPFVNLTNGVFANLIDTMVNALDFDRRTFDRGEKSTTNGKYISMYDAKLYYTHTISQMTEIFSRNLSHLQPHGIFNRQTFEQNYNLIWRPEPNVVKKIIRETPPQTVLTPKRQRTCY